MAHPKGCARLRESMKKCKGCGVDKGIEEFYKHSRTGNSYGICKKCHGIQRMEYQRKNREKYLEIGRRYRTRNAEKVAAASRRWRQNLKKSNGAAYELYLRNQNYKS